MCLCWREDHGPWPTCAPPAIFSHLRVVPCILRACCCIPTRPPDRFASTRLSFILAPRGQRAGFRSCSPLDPRHRGLRSIDGRGLRHLGSTMQLLGHGRFASSSSLDRSQAHVAQQALARDWGREREEGGRGRGEGVVIWEWDRPALACGP